MAIGLTCGEFKTHVPALAVAALDASAEAACRAHLRDPGPHDGCREAFQRAEATAAKLGLALAPVRPRERVWHAIERATGYKAIAEVPRSTLFRQIAAWTLTAVASLMLLRTHTHAERVEEQLHGTGRALTKVRNYAADMGKSLDQARNRETEARQQLANAVASQSATQECLAVRTAWHNQLVVQNNALAMLEQSATRVLPMRALEGKAGHATVVFNAEQGRAIVFAVGLPERAGRAWQLWVVHDGVATAAGFLSDPVDGMATGEIAPSVLAIDVPEAIAISAEPAGGAFRPGEVVVYGVIRASVARVAPLRAGAR